MGAKKKEKKKKGKRERKISKWKKEKIKFVAHSSIFCYQVCYTDEWNSSWKHGIWKMV